MGGNMSNGMNGCMNGGMCSGSGINGCMNGGMRSCGGGAMGSGIGGAMGSGIGVSMAPPLHIPPLGMGGGMGPGMAMGAAGGGGMCGGMNGGMDGCLSSSWIAAGKGGCSSQAEEGGSFCSLHSKNRDASNLFTNGSGVLVCKPGYECREIGGNDWRCLSCGDYQYGRNLQCTKCGANRPDAFIGNVGCGASSGSQDGAAGNPRFAKALQTLLTMAKALKNGGGGEGTPFNLKANQSWQGHPQGPHEACSIHGKMRGPSNLVPDGQGGKRCIHFSPCQIGNKDKGDGTKGPKEGDWICPNCGDHQFARNTQCRQCQTVKPENAMPFLPADEKAEPICSLHNKKRSLANLIPDGLGGRRCSPVSQCKVGDGVPRSLPY